MLGGSGNDRMIGGGGNDILDGDAWLHVALTKDGPGGQIIRQILYDADGNTWDPLTETGHVNAVNVDTAVFTDVMANYNVALFGPDAEGFLTIQHNVAGVPAAGVVDDGTDRSATSSVSSSPTSPLPSTKMATCLTRWSAMLTMMRCRLARHASPKHRQLAPWSIRRSPSRSAAR